MLYSAQLEKQRLMQNLNHLLHFDPEDPQPYTPELERVDEDEILFARDLSHREEVRARARSVIELMQHGMQVEQSPNADLTAAEILQDKEPLSSHVTKPDVILHLEAMMTEFDHEVVQDAVRMRRFVTNKLMLEANTATKSSERIKALELLGKISDVGLFAERNIMTIEHKTTEELQQEFEKTINLLLNPTTNIFEPAKAPAPGAVNLREIKIDV
jgi:flagellar biosynthesis regulator FlbT